MRNREISPSSDCMSEKARSLRKEMTSAEHLLWSRLKSKQVNGLRFRRQEPVGRYIADFLCVSARLIIEVDGWSHEDRTKYDENRDIFLRSIGYRVLHFSKDDVISQTDSVIDIISKASVFVGGAPTQPPPEGEGPEGLPHAS